ncbi:MAG: polysaccharide biosynthesis tyrosine autokinase [Clostridiales bacterium]|nr:polysaccharide biosynthesis tyrosine autokinase [Clostridiales bacterium]
MRELRSDFINFYTIVKDIFKNLIFIILAALTGFFSVRAYYDFTYTAVYQSTATIAISATDSGTYTYSNLNKTIEAASTFQEMFQSSYFKEKLEDVTGIPVDGTITATQVSETNLITISYSCGSPMTAYTMLEAIIGNYDVITDYTFDDMIINIISSPSIPYSPSNSISYYNYDYIAAAAAALAVLFIVVVFSYFRDTIKNETDVNAMLDTDLFGVIYHEEKKKSIGSIDKMVSADENQIIYREKKLNGIKSRLGFIRARVPLMITNILISYKFAEAFRIAALKLEYVLNSKHIKTVMITSCGENEGKTTVAVNLALSMASLGKKTLLVDADLRKPAVFNFFNNENADELNGIGEVINGKTSVNSAVIEDEKTGLYVMCGKQKYRNSSEMLSTGKMQKIVDFLKSRFDVIIFDTSPTTLVSDTEIIASYIDTAIIVARQDMAPVPEINDMIESISASGAEIAGCILNDVHLLPVFEGSRVISAENGEKTAEREVTA